MGCRWRREWTWWRWVRVNRDKTVEGVREARKRWGWGELGSMCRLPMRRLL